MHPVRALFRRNAWAMARLLEFCSRQPDLAAVEVGSDIYGGIQPLFNHILAAETRYLRRLTGDLPDDHVHESSPRALPDLVEPGRTLAHRWERFLESEAEPDWVPMAQCLHHGDDHRAQVGTALGRLGAEPPELDGWHYGLDPESSAKPSAPPWAPALLRRCFGHHLWATRRLLERCLDLSAEQLGLSAPGTYGASCPRSTTWSRPTGGTFPGSRVAACRRRSARSRCNLCSTSTRARTSSGGHIWAPSPTSTPRSKPATASTRRG